MLVMWGIEVFMVSMFGLRLRFIFIAYLLIFIVDIYCFIDIYCLS